MGTPLCRVVFKGEVAEGQSREQVMQRVKALCKYDDAALSKFFSGRPCVVRDRLEPQQAQMYKSALEKTGAICHIVKVPPPPTQSVQTKRVDPPPPPVKSMTCPKCNRQQPEAVLCMQCGINIERFQKRQFAEHDQMFPTADDGYNATYSPSEVTIAQLLLSPEGRVNRQKYILINLALGFITVPANYILVNISFFAYLVAILGVTYVSLILSIKRAHDRDISGHFCWLLFVPIVSLWPCIVLIFMKGTDGNNRFGADPLRA